MKNSIIIFITILCFGVISTNAQNSLKRTKQTNRFHYLQANLHVGYQSGAGFDLSNTGPNNRLVYQYMSKNQRLMQKGYVRNVALSSFKVKLSLDMTGNLQDLSPSYQLKLQNVGMKFATKWDRTSFYVGYANIKLGHNPKIDPVTSFVSNSLKLDIGFTQDLGVSFKTPISQKFDLEAAIYTGGILSSPLVTYSLNPSGEQENNSIEFINPKYTGSWLGTLRIGSPAFKSFEYGAIAMAGKHGEGMNERHITRIGFDAVKKVKERFKFESQVHGGMSSYNLRSNTFDVAVQSNLEFYIKGLFIISTSNAILFAFTDEEAYNGNKGTAVNSLSYVISPHTRVRLNQFYNYGNLRDNKGGISAQLVTGIGKR